MTQPSDPSMGVGAPAGAATADALRSPGSPAAVVRGPAAQLLAEMPPVLARGLVYLVAAGLLTALVWACVARVDVVVEATGRLQPAADIIEIQAPQSGQVREILAQPGHAVTTGQVLYVLQSLEQKTQVERLGQERDNLLRSIRDLGAGIAFLRETLRTEAFPTAQGWTECPLEGLVATVNSLVASRQRLDVARINLFDVLGQMGLPVGIRTRETEEFRLRVAMKQDDLAKSRATLRAHQAELETARQNLSVAQDLFRTYESLHKDGVVSRVEYLGQVKERSTARTSLAAAQANVLKDQRDIAQLETDLRLLTDQVRREEREARREHTRAQAQTTHLWASWLQELDRKQKRLPIVLRDIEMAQRELSKTHVRAPTSGTIDDVRIHHVGAVVSSSQAVMTLVPSSCRLEAEVMLENKDVGALSPGISARVKVDAFPFNEYGHLPGTLRLIAPEATAGKSQYRGRIALDPTATLVSADNRIAVLRSGMKLKAEIVKEKRRIIKFLIKPFMGLRRRTMSIEG